jgi:hypothetical protein
MNILNAPMNSQPEICPAVRLVDPWKEEHYSGDRPRVADMPSLKLYQELAEW